MDLLRSKINALADEHASNLNQKIISRKEEMKKDDNSHYLIYRVLGISYEEGFLIDEYQNTGRFLYKYAGSFWKKLPQCAYFLQTAMAVKFLWKIRKEVSLKNLKSIFKR